MTVGELIKELAKLDFDLVVRAGVIPKGNRRIKADLNVLSVNTWGGRRIGPRPNEVLYAAVLLTREGEKS